MSRNIMFLGENMTVTTLSQMPHTEIDDSFKSELFLPRSVRRSSVFASFTKESSYSHGN